MKTFSYPYTCPDIDRNIESFKDSLESLLNNLSNDLNPLFYNSPEYEDFILSYKNQVYKIAEPIFENVRDCNSTMRDEIDRHEKELFDRIEELEDEKRNLEQQINDLEKENETLQEQISDLENENMFLEKQLDDKEY